MFAVFVLVALLAVSVPVAAAEKEDAAAEFSRAVELIDAGRIGEALTHFRRAYELVPHYSVLYNIARAHSDLGQPVEAVEVFRRYLADGGERIPPTRKASVEQQMEDLEATIASVEVRVAVPGAAIRLDGAEVGHSPLESPVRLDPGPHTVSAAHPLYGVAEQSVSLYPGQHAGVTLTLTFAGEAPSGAVDHAVSQHADGGRAVATTRRTVARTERTLGLSLGAAGVVWLGVGALFAVNAQAKDQQSDRECGKAGNPNYCSTQGLALNDQAIRAANVARVSFAVGGVAVAAGAVLLGVSVATDARAPDGMAVTAQVGQGVAGCSVRGRW